MVSWWGTDSYLNNEPIQIGDIKIMNYANSSSVLFFSRVRSKYIWHNAYLGRRSNLPSQPAPIHGPLQKSYLNYSYSRSHFSRLPQAVAKNLYIVCLRKLVMLIR